MVVEFRLWQPFLLLIFQCDGIDRLQSPRSVASVYRPAHQKNMSLIVSLKIQVLYARAQNCKLELCWQLGSRELNWLV